MADITTTSTLHALDCFLCRLWTFVLSAWLHSSSPFLKNGCCALGVLQYLTLRRGSPGFNHPALLTDICRDLLIFQPLFLSTEHFKQVPALVTVVNCSLFCPPAANGEEWRCIFLEMTQLIFPPKSLTNNIHHSNNSLAKTLTS